jgi:hypothetical protein
MRTGASLLPSGCPAQAGNPPRPPSAGPLQVETGRQQRHHDDADVWHLDQPRVESTALDGWKRGYRIFFVEDAMAGLSAGAHAFTVTTILPRTGVVWSCAEVLTTFGE